MSDWILARLKAVVAFAGLALFYLQAYQTSNPSSKVGVLIAVLTVLGVHATPNL